MAPSPQAGVNPAAFSGLTDSLTSAASGSSAAKKASSLTKTQATIATVFAILGFLIIVSALWWACSAYRRRRVARKQANKPKPNFPRTIDANPGYGHAQELLNSRNQMSNASLSSVSIHDSKYTQQQPVFYAY